MTAREAMAYGRPVVATAVGGLADAVDDGETGLLVAPRDVAQLRAALTRLLGDGGLRNSLGARGREVATDRSSPAAAAGALSAVYAETAGSSRAV
jgi:glycosyltransferase involved in cell wall biosynthesis